MRLHLGCGKRYLPGWVHVDLTPGPHIDFLASIGELSMFESGSVSEIYCSHALEYFDRVQAADVLREWNRVLTSGGKLFLAVPDFQALIRIYEESRDLNSILGPLFGRMTSGLPLQTIYHRTTFDRESLVSLLNENGFVNIVEYDPISFLGQIDPNYDDHSLAFFPHMDRGGIQVSLCICAESSNGDVV
jgi:SAM-dependent methyltransferase